MMFYNLKFTAPYVQFFNVLLHMISYQVLMFLSVSVD